MKVHGKCMLQMKNEDAKMMNGIHFCTKLSVQKSQFLYYGKMKTSSRLNLGGELTFVFEAQKIMNK